MLKIVCMEKCVLKFVAKVSKSGKSYYVRIPLSSVESHSLAGKYVDVEIGTLGE